MTVRQVCLNNMSFGYSSKQKESYMNGRVVVHGETSRDTTSKLRDLFHLIDLVTRRYLKVLGLSLSSTLLLSPDKGWVGFSGFQVSVSTRNRPQSYLGYVDLVGSMTSPLITSMWRTTIRTFISRSTGNGKGHLVEEFRKMGKQPDETWRTDNWRKCFILEIRILSFTRSTWEWVRHTPNKLIDQRRIKSSRHYGFKNEMN